MNPMRASLRPQDETFVSDCPVVPPHHWGDGPPPLDHLPAGAAAMDAGDSWPLERRQRERINAATTRGRIEGAFIGFCLAMLAVVGGCTLFAAADRAPVVRSVWPVT